MLNITRRDIEEAHSYARDAMRQARDMSGKGESVVGSVVQTLEVSAGALAIGALTGYVGPLHYKGSAIPLDLVAGIAGHLAGFMGVAGRQSAHLHNFSDGILAGYLTKLGVGFGTELRAKAGKPALNLQASKIAGEIDGYGGYAQPAPLSENELAAMAQSVR